MPPNNIVDDDHRDDFVDQIIRNCLDQDNPKSFFLFAGAGSGKTKSLIDALNFFLDKYVSASRDPVLDNRKGPAKAGPLDYSCSKQLRM